MLSLMLGYGKCMPLRGKRPKVSGWREDSFKGIADPNYKDNYAFIIPDGMAVLDVDPRNVPAGRNTIQELMDRVGYKRLNTLQVLSGGGGLHIYFKIPKNIKLKSKLNEYPGIDCKQSGGYTVGPGSIHPVTGKPYIIRRNFPLMDMPNELLSMLFMEKVNPIKKENDVYSEFCIDYRKKEIERLDPVTEGGRDNFLYRQHVKNRDYGLSLDESTELLKTFGLRCLPSMDWEEVYKTGLHAYQYAQNSAGCSNPENDFPDLSLIEVKETEVNEKNEQISWDMDPHGKLKKTLKNCINFLRLKPNFLKYNTFTNTIDIVGKYPWVRLKSLGVTLNAFDILELKNYYSIKDSYEVDIKIWREAVSLIAIANEYNPLQDKLNSFKWDGIPRLDSWLFKYAGVSEDPISSLMGRKWLLSCVYRAFKPGCKSDYMLVLEGPQGPGKTKLCNILGFGYTAEISFTGQQKDIAAGLQGKWIIEMAEMASYTKAGVAEMKRVISATVDRVRMPYKEDTIDYHRSCNFIGTINPEECGYLKDSDNRRYWTVTVSQPMNLALLEKDLELLWAEVVHFYKKGEANWIEDPEMESKVRAVTNTRKIKEPWTEDIIRYLDDVCLQNFERDEVTVGELYKHALNGNPAQMHHGHRDRIQNVLRECGWIKKETPRIITYLRPNLLDMELDL